MQSLLQNPRRKFSIFFNIIVAKLYLLVIYPEIQRVRRNFAAEKKMKLPFFQTDTTWRQFQFQKWLFGEILRLLKMPLGCFETLMATVFLWKTLIVTGLSDLGALPAGLKPLTALSDQSIIIHPSSK